MKTKLIALIALLFLGSQAAHAQEIYGLPVEASVGRSVVVQRTFGLTLAPVQRVANVVVSRLQNVVVPQKQTYVVPTVQPTNVQPMTVQPVAPMTYAAPVVVQRRRWIQRRQCVGGQCQLVWVYE